MSMYLEGELLYLYWDGKVEYYLIKGHVSEEVADTIIRGEYGEFSEEVVEYSHKFAFIGRMTYDGEKTSGVFLRDESGRGRFKVTVALTRHGKERSG